MGGKQVKPDINFGQYQNKFRNVSQNCQNSPVEQRSCKDVCCLVTFIILSLFFVGSGIYFIASIDRGDFARMRNAYDNSTSSSGSKSSLINGSVNSSTKVKIGHNVGLFQHNELSSTSLDHLQVSLASSSASTQFPDMLKALPWIALMGTLALILSFVIVIAVSKIPKVVIYGMLIFTTILIIAGIVGGILLDILQLTIISVVFGVFWGLLLAVMLCCHRDQCQAAIMLLKVTGNFIKKKPSILLAPIFVMFIACFYFAFWLISLVGIQADRPFQQNNSNSTSSQGSGRNSSGTSDPQYHYTYHDVFTIIWIFLNLFFSYFLYYVLVFLIATATAFWYYNIEANYLFKGMKFIWSAHIGSFTFASLMIAIVSFLKSAANNQNTENGCACVCFCILRCCLAFLQEIIKALNHNAIIVMSVTAQDFIDSAKSAIYLIYQNFGLFIAVEMVEFLLKVCVLYVVILLPTGLGLLLLKLTFDQSASSQDLYLIIGATIIFIICLLVSLLIVTVLSQTLNCVFIFFCLDQKFRALNFGVINRVPHELRALFNEVQGTGRSLDVNSFYKDQNQMVENNNNNNNYNNRNQMYPNL